MNRNKRFHIFRHCEEAKGRRSNLRPLDCFTSFAMTSFALLALCLAVAGCGGEKKSEYVEYATFELANKGTEDIVDYEKYGKFEGMGTPEYRYVIKDQAGLTRAAGEGIHPNSSSVMKDPEYKLFKKEGRLKGSHWDFINSPDYQASFYKWATAPEERGVKLFYTAFALERAGLIKHAIKAYYALAVYFPKTIGWTYWHTPWPVGQVAIDRIEYLCKRYPALGWKLEGASIINKGGYDDDVRNDVFIINPGKIIRCKKSKLMEKRRDLSRQKVVSSTGDEHIKLLQYEDKSWQLLVDNAPYIIKGVAYQPGMVGQSPDEGTLDDWMQADYNGNNKIDSPYDAWADKNRNNTQDEDEKAVGDFRLLWEMGANTIRVYHHASNKPLLKDLYENYGIMVLMGDFLGAYAVGSGATWYNGTDYTSAEQKEKMLKSVGEMVDEYKDEPYVLMWVLGNENNYGVANNSKQKPEEYYSFVNEVAKFIKSRDPHKRPVVICNGEVKYLDIFARSCPSVDIFGVNAYRGDYGFGHLWASVKDEANKPVLITEYGCPAFSKHLDEQDAEVEQARFLANCWVDIVSNSDGYGEGNALGGVAFEWVDEWWKAYEPSLHDEKPLWAGTFPDGWMHEEWLGVTSQGDGKNSPYQRILRKAYYEFQKMWKD